MQADLSTPQAVSTAVRVCAHCGAAGSTRFCGECGRPYEAASADPGLLREGVAELLGIEHGILGTLRDQLIRPVKVFTAYLDGNADGYVRPLKLFFLLAGAYMLLLSLFRPITFDIGMLTNQSNPEWARAVTELIARKGITQEVLDERLQSRMNTAAPLVVALSLLPMALLLKAMRRDRPYREHVMFLLSFSNSIWLLSILMLPLSSQLGDGMVLLLQLVGYVYMGIGFFAFYRSETQARTSGKFAVYVVTDLVLTYLVGILMFAGVLLTILLL